MRQLFDQVSALLKEVDFGALWPGFGPCDFALFDQEKVVLADREIPWDKRFLGSTSIDFEGRPLAIWYMGAGDNSDRQVLACNLVHEMFHAHQEKMGDGRRASDLMMVAYPMEERLFQLRYAENRLLADIIDQAEPPGRLADFIAWRKYRQGLAEDYIRCEYLTETLEGMAEYVGLMALGQIAPDKYRARLGEYSAKLRQTDGLLFDVRRMAYFSGTLFMTAAGMAGIDLGHDIGREARTVFELAAGQMPAAPPGDARSDAVSRGMAQVLAARQAEYDSFLAGQTQRAEGDFVIRGYDPMNMTRLGDLMLCSRFVMLAQGGGEPQFVGGPVMLEMEPGTLDKVRAYVK